MVMRERAWGAGWGRWANREKMGGGKRLLGGDGRMMHCVDDVLLSCTHETSTPINSIKILNVL